MADEVFEQSTGHSGAYSSSQYSGYDSYGPSGGGRDRWYVDSWPVCVGIICYIGEMVVAFVVSLIVIMSLFEAVCNRRRCNV